MVRHLDHVFNASQVLRWEGKNRLDTKENDARLRRGKALVRSFQKCSYLLSRFKAFFISLHFLYEFCDSREEIATVTMRYQG